MLQPYLRHTRFHRQLFAILIIAILGFALFSSLLTVLESSRQMKTYQHQQGQQIAENLARQSVQALLYQSKDSIRDAVQTTLAFPDVLKVKIVDKYQHTLISEVSPAISNSSAHQASELSLFLGKLLLPETTEELQFSAPVWNGQRSALDPQTENQELLGEVQISIGLSSLNQMIAALISRNLLATLGFAIVLIVAVSILTKHLLRPLRQLSGIMRDAERGITGLRAQMSGPIDIIEMGQAFNKMMQVLEQRETELTQSRDAAVMIAKRKAEFAATVSHEIRTPLNGVVGMLELLKEMHLNRRQKECVDVAWNSSRALMDLVNDILDFSRLEAGKLTLEQRDFDLREVLEDSLDMLAQQAQQKGLELAYHLPADVPDMIVGDPFRLRQVLLNLLGNAIKFSEHGDIEVRVQMLTSPTGVNNDHLLKIEVIDQGIGIDEYALQDIFDSFAQADAATPRQYGGSGLGLAICKQLVELMHGEIGAYSQPGKGSCFWITMAYREGTRIPDRSITDDLRGVRVLVVDESIMIRNFLQQNLQAFGMQCTLASTLQDARLSKRQAEEEQQPFQLCIIDSGLVQHPASHDCSDLPCLLLDRYGSLIHGTQQHRNLLSKPIRRQRLHASLLTLLRQSVSKVAETTLRHENTQEYRVLVAEDNRTNQIVAAGMLSMLGCCGEFANDGREAIDAALARRFDLILMDCNMPDVDGYEATAHIRLFEEALGRRTPIIAMTANAQSGDAEKCLAAGMDDYISKPITLAVIKQKLEHWLQSAPLACHASLPSAQPSSDSQEALDEFSFATLSTVLGSALPHAIAPFLEDMPLSLQQMAQALKLSDFARFKQIAHSIKGSSSHLGANRIASLARTMEELDAAQPSGLQQAHTLLDALQQAFQEVSQQLQEKLRRKDGSTSAVKEELGHVLIVDDDRSTRSALRYTLQHDGFRVDEASNGAQALEMLKRLQPDVILMDAMMPVMDGFTACARIQALPHGSDMPVLMITALDDNSSVERAFAAGASDYVPKPVHFAVLCQRVRRMIEANRAEKRIRHLAYNDSLTGLPNRAQFHEQLNFRLSQPRDSDDMLAVLFLDLDRFKNVNDTLGHDIGDGLLMAVAHRIRHAVRNIDNVARLGGDEFTVILENIRDANAAASASQNIVRALSTPFQINGHDIFISTSIGIALYPHDGQDLNSLLKHADAAMYNAKRRNLGFQFYEANMELSISERLRTENDLRHALERAEFEIYYQPQARLDNYAIVGAEALIRWNHPTRGLVSPLEFIPLTEEIDLINPIGTWVLRTACQQAQDWIASGLPPLRIAVNLSARQFLQRDFADIVENILRETGLPAHLLELEITESCLMEHIDDTLIALQNLRKLGLRLAIDDFGTGYSSLAYLKRFPVNTLKIDRSFIHDLEHHAHDAAIVNGILALAHSLSLEVVAEGVETEQQRHFLQTRACNTMQGYFLSKPVNATDFAVFLASHDAATAHMQAKS